MPKFKSESTHDLIDSLCKVGLSKLFSKADFSAISSEFLSVDKVLQKAFIDVIINYFFLQIILIIIY